MTYFDEAAQEEVFQPADIVIMAAYSLHNTHLCLLSGIGQPYDPASGDGVTGRNYAYQMTGGTTTFFEDVEFNPFIGSGSTGYVIDDYAINQLDFAAEGFIGGGYIHASQHNGQPIRNLPLPAGVPAWGAGWKQGVKEWYGHAMGVGLHGSNMAYRDCYLDLDPTYTDRHGRPLLRMTFDWKDNDARLSQFMKSKIEPVVKALRPTSFTSSYKDMGCGTRHRWWPSFYRGAMPMRASRGGMASVIEDSLQYMTDADATAMAVYLRHVATDADALDTPTLARTNSTDTETAAMLLAASPDMDLGARLYLDNCNACQFNTGTGADGVFPELVGNSNVLAEEPGGFLQVILNGAAMPSTATRPARLRMPPFRDRLSDNEVATLATFVRQSWGNNASPVAANAVSEVRAVSPELQVPEARFLTGY